MIKDQPVMGRVYSVCFMCFLYFCFGRGGVGSGLECFLSYSKHSREERGFTVSIPFLLHLDAGSIQGCELLLMEC